MRRRLRVGLRLVLVLVLAALLAVGVNIRQAQRAEATPLVAPLVPLAVMSGPPGWAALGVGALVMGSVLVAEGIRRDAEDGEMFWEGAGDRWKELIGGTKKAWDNRGEGEPESKDAPKTDPGAPFHAGTIRISDMLLVADSNGTRMSFSTSWPNAANEGVVVNRYTTLSINSKERITCRVGSGVKVSESIRQIGYMGQSLVAAGATKCPDSMGGDAKLVTVDWFPMSSSDWQKYGEPNPNSNSWTHKEVFHFVAPNSYDGTDGFKNTVTCKAPDGSSTIVAGSSKDSEGMKVPYCPEGYEVDGIKTERTYPDGTTNPTPIAETDVTGKRPVDVLVDGQQCVQGREGCADWTQVRATNPERVQCVSNGVVIHSSHCNVLERFYENGGTVVKPENIDGDPSTYWDPWLKDPGFTGVVTQPDGSYAPAPERPASRPPVTSPAPWDGTAPVIEPTTQPTTQPTPAPTEAPPVDPYTDPDSPLYDPSLDPNAPEYDPKKDPEHEEYYPKRDPRNPAYEPERDPRHPDYDPYLDPYSPLYDPYADPDSPLYDPDGPEPTPSPSEPAPEPTTDPEPSQEPTQDPSPEPTQEPSPEPSAEPTGDTGEEEEPEPDPSAEPTPDTSPSPQPDPTLDPTDPPVKTLVDTDEWGHLVPITASTGVMTLDPTGARVYTSPETGVRTLYAPDGTSTTTVTLAPPVGAPPGTPTPDVVTVKHPDGTRETVGYPETPKITTPGNMQDAPPRGEVPEIVVAPVCDTGLCAKLPETPNWAKRENCMAGGWGWNPIDWVKKPVVCALREAFEPDPTKLEANVGRVRVAMEAVGFKPLVVAFQSVVVDLPAGGEGCMGPPITVPLGGEETTFYFFQACEGGSKEVAAYTNAFVTFAAGFFGIWAVIRNIAFGFGHTVKVAEQGEGSN